MGLGIRRIINKIKINFDIFHFYLIYKIFDFNEACHLFFKINKNSVIPILRKFGATIEDNCDIEKPLLFHNCNNFSNLYIGSNCHIGKYCFFDLKDKIIIKSNCTISMFTKFITHLDVGNSNLSELFKMESQPIDIDENCYIGANTTILMGVRIGLNSFIGANSLVNKNIEPYTMVGGIPVKVIKKLDNNSL